MERYLRTGVREDMARLESKEGKKRKDIRSKSKRLSVNLFVAQIHVLFNPLSIFFILTFSARSPRLQYHIAHSFHFMRTKSMLKLSSFHSDAHHTVALSVPATGTHAKAHIICVLLLYTAFTAGNSKKKDVLQQSAQSLLSIFLAF